MDAFSMLYEKYAPMILRRCRYLLKDEEKALDCMQDVFVSVIERREKMSRVCSSFFYTVATNICLNKIRSDNVRRSSKLDGYLNDIPDVKSSNHEKQTDDGLFLDFLFYGLNGCTQNLAILHYVEGLTLKETAVEMNMTLASVRYRLNRLRKKALQYG